MKTASPELIQLLNNSESLKMADLYMFTLTNGTSLHYTTADIDIRYNGNVYKCSNAGLKRDSMSWLTGLAVDNLIVEFYPSDSDKIGDISFIEAFRNGTFDGAEMRLEWAFFKDWHDSPLVLNDMFVGNVDIDEIGGNYAKVEVKSPIERFNTKFPPDIYQSACSYTLFGAGCNVSKASFSINGSVLSGSDKKVIKCNLSKPDGYFSQGVVLFTSGKNLNVKRSIKSHGNGSLSLSVPLQYAPTSGDTFTVSAGCDHTISTCKNKFNNLLNFSGCPYIPDPEQSL